MYLSHAVDVESRFRVSKAAQSRRGKRKTAFPPDPLLSPWSCVSGCKPGRLWLLRVALNFRFQRKQPFAKSPHGLLCKLSGSRTGWWERVAHSCGENKRPSARQIQICRMPQNVSPHIASSSSFAQVLICQSYRHDQRLHTHGKNPA